MLGPRCFLSGGRKMHQIAFLANVALKRVEYVRCYRANHSLSLCCSLDRYKISSGWRCGEARPPVGGGACKGSARGWRRDSRQLNHQNAKSECVLAPTGEGNRG